MYISRQTPAVAAAKPAVQAPRKPTHDASVAAAADRRIQMLDGRIVSHAS